MRFVFKGIALLAALLAVLAQAQDYPTRPIRLIVAFAPGGVVDTAARVLSLKMTERLGWQFVVDNRAGGSGLIGGGIAARAAPDGYTIYLAHTGEFAINQWVFRNVPFDVDNGFIPVTMVNDGPMLVVVNAQSPIGSFKDMIAAARAKPGAITYGSPGFGAVNHLAAEWIASAAGVKFLNVTYKGAAPAVSAVSSNEVALTVAGVPGVLPHLEARRVKVLGVTTARRWDFGRDWTPAAEAGMPGVDASIWTGLFVPKGTPRTVVDRIYREAAATLRQPDIKERFWTLGSEPVTMPPAEFAAKVKRDAERYRKVVQDIGLQAQ
jgi:tripartite-type tricarboxylate transporter receptor subunit TctC